MLKIWHYKQGEQHKIVDDMKPKYAINLDIAELDKSETYAKEEVLLEDCS